MAGGEGFYSTLTSSFQKVYERTFVKNPLVYYFRYASYLAFTEGPKISYANHYEPEYTKAKVRYNLPIVVALVASTLFLTHSVNSNKKQWWWIWIHESYLD